MFYIRGGVPELNGSICEKVVKEEKRIVDNGFLSHVCLHLKVKEGQWHKILPCSGLLLWYQSDEPPFAPADNTFFRFVHELFDLGEQCPDLVTQRIESMELQETENHNQMHIQFAGGSSICVQQPRDMAFRPQEVCDIIVQQGRKV